MKDAKVASSSFQSIQAFRDHLFPFPVFFFIPKWFSLHTTLAKKEHLPKRQSESM